MELTDKMLEAGCVEYRSDFLSISNEKQEALKKTMRSVWTAMLSAAPASAGEPQPFRVTSDEWEAADLESEHCVRLSAVNAVLARRPPAPVALPLTRELAKQLVEAYGDDDDNTEYVEHMLGALKGVFGVACPSVPAPLVEYAWTKQIAARLWDAFGNTADDREPFEDLYEAGLRVFGDLCPSVPSETRDPRAAVAVDQVARIIAEYPEDWEWPGKVSTPTLNKYRMLASKVLGALAEQPATQAPVPMPMDPSDLRKLVWDAAAVLTKHASAAPVQESFLDMTKVVANSAASNAYARTRAAGMEHDAALNDAVLAVLAVLAKRSPEPAQVKTGVSPSWVLSQLAGMQFRSPAGADAYDYMKRSLAAALQAEGPAGHEPAQAAAGQTVGAWTASEEDAEEFCQNLPVRGNQTTPERRQAKIALQAVFDRRFGSSAVQVPDELRSHYEKACAHYSATVAQLEAANKRVAELEQEVEDLGVKVSDAEGHAPDGVTVESLTNEIEYATRTLCAGFSEPSREIIDLASACVRVFEAKHAKLVEVADKLRERSREAYDVKNQLKVLREACTLSDSEGHAFDVTSEPHASQKLRHYCVLRLVMARIQAALSAQPAECAHDWQETGGESDVHHTEVYQRCTKCKAEQTIETPRSTLGEALDKAHAAWAADPDPDPEPESSEIAELRAMVARLRNAAITTLALVLRKESAITEEQVVLDARETLRTLSMSALDGEEATGG